MVKIDESDCIRRILYSPDGSRILLHTNEHKLYLYDLPNKKAIPVSNSENQCYGAYHYPMFLPDTNNVIAFICNEYYAHYYDLRNNEEITSFRLKIEDIPSFSNDNFLTNIFDISCQTSQLITALNTFNAQSSTVGNIKHLMHKYVLFKNFFNDKGYPLEIAKLIANFFYHLYPFRLSDS